MASCHTHAANSPQTSVNSVNSVGGLTQPTICVDLCNPWETIFPQNARNTRNLLAEKHLPQNAQNTQNLLAEKPLPQNTL